ncbi:STAS/SEC14 domain-containing protein [candidate division WOR-3 bacterium]|nr:STAS/SEC14 domain-containing protein [candidate division WOR-3 bacterium]
MKYEILTPDGTLRHEIFYNTEFEAAYIVHYDRVNADDARQIIDSVAELLEGKKHRYMVDDISRVSMTKLDKETRAVFAKAGEKIQLEKIAMIGADPMTRMMSKVVVALTGEAKRTKFFRTEQEALAWLKGV